MSTGATELCNWFLSIQPGANAFSLTTIYYELLQDALAWSIQPNFAARLGHKARFAFDHAQYFKAIALLWEAILVAGCLTYDIPNPTSRKAREQAEDELYKRLTGTARRTLQQIEWLRNEVMHGTQPFRGDTARARHDEQDFKHLFTQGWELFNHLLLNK